MILYVADIEGYFTNSKVHSKGEALPKIYSGCKPQELVEGRVLRLTSYIKSETPDQELSADIWSLVDPRPTIIERGITIITTGSMQTRFSIAEEVAITDGTDSVAKVLLSRLFNSKNINLELDELTSGVAYIVNYLDSVGAIHLNVSPSERIDQLLVDGTPDEEYV